MKVHEHLPVPANLKGKHQMQHKTPGDFAENRMG